MKPVRIAVCMKEPAFGRAVARGLAESGNGFLIEVAEPGPPEVPETQEMPEPSGAGLPEEWVRRSETWEVLVTDCGPEACMGGGSGAGLKDNVEEQGPGLVIVDPETCRISQLCREIQAAADRVRERRCTVSGESLQHRRGTWQNGHRNGDGRPGNGDRPTEIIGFLGLCGGCGVTALAVTTGRMLAGAYGEKVLYLPLTETDGAWVYREAELLQKKGSSGEYPSGACPPGDYSPGACPQRGKELLYRLSHQLPCSVERFMVRDGYGLEMPEGMDCLPAEERMELLTHLAEKGGYDWIILDLGSRESLRTAGKRETEICSALVEVGNRMDGRCGLHWPIAPNLPITSESLHTSENGKPSAFFPERRIMVWNHGTENREPAVMAASDEQPVILEIAHDRESFLPNRETGRIEIAMTKNFAIGVKNLTEILMNFYENDLRNLSNEAAW